MENVRTMKRTCAVLALLALMPLARVFAQEGGIVFTDLEPDPYLDCASQYETKTFDLDYDSIPDIQIHCHWNSLISVWFELSSTHDDFLLCLVNENDTISLADEWNSKFDAPNPDGWQHLGFRIERDGAFYYGWFRLYAIKSEYKWYLDKFAYCTIPNHSLCWGQTSLDWGVGEAGDTACASVHPNPTGGQVTITGKDLRQAEVINTLGQRVATATGQGETLQADLGGLPAGVYFVNVTDGGGRKCVRMVVKE